MTSVTSEAPDGFRAGKLGRWRALLSVLCSLLLLVVCLWAFDAKEIGATLATVDTRWLWLVLAVRLPELVVLGVRYANISRSLGLELGVLRGIREYALSILLNQLLPLGVLGDGLRAVRQARASRQKGLFVALEAVALDRIAGQFTLWLVVLFTLPFAARAARFDVAGVLVAVSVAIASGLVLAVAIHKSQALRRRVPKLVELVQTAARVLLAPKALLVHVPLSLALTGLLLLELYVAGRAVGVDLSFAALLSVGPLILASMSLPSFFAGWGIREGSSALLFLGLGLSAESGVAVAFVYGAFSLVVSLPGAAVLLAGARSEPAFRVRWSQAHALGMLVGSALLLLVRRPELVALVAGLSFGALVLGARGAYTARGNFGVANGVTSLRLLLTLLMLVYHATWSAHGLTALALSVLVLDIVDGWLARRRAEASDFGADYDVEVDTLLVVSLGLAVLARHPTALWVLLPPCLRYVYVLAPAIVAPRGVAVSRSRLGRLAYVVMITCFLFGVVLPTTLAPGITLLGTIVVSASFGVSFWQRYARGRAAGQELEQ